MKEEASIADKLSFIVHLKQMLGFVWKASPNAVVFLSVLVFIQGVFPLAMLYLIKLIVDQAGIAISSHGEGLNKVLILVGIAGTIGMLRIICQQISGFASETLSLNVSDYIYDVLHKKSIEVDLEFYENPSYFDTLHRAQMEGPHRPAKIVNNLISFGQNFVSLTAVTALLVYFHWSVPLILFAAAIPGVLVRIKFSKIMYKWQRKRTETQREVSYLSWLITGYIHAKELRLFDLGNLFSKQFSSLRKVLRTEMLGISAKRSIYSVFAQGIPLCIMFALLCFIVYRAVHGHISIGDLVMYYQAIQRGLGYFKSLLGGVTSLYEDNLFIAYFYEFMNIKEKIKDPAFSERMPDTIKRGISFQNVSFTYPLSEKKALDNITFSIKPGEIVAFVGKNGAGKSTLTKLLCRLYDPESGTISIDGTDIRKFKVKDLQSKIGVIFQDFAKYHFTAEKNIWIGNIKIPSSSLNIKKAAKKANADDFIQKLPQRYNTILGKMFKSGEELSGGQWQKIALARAFMRNGELVILDEPASSLDADSEYEVFKNFKRLLKGKSAVLVSHRFSTVKMADKVIVIQSGRIVEQGSHPELLKNKGPYSDWFEKQSIVAGVDSTPTC